MQIGFIGMKYSGKSTLFQLLTGDHYETMRTHAGEYFRGNVLVPDSRIDALSTIYQPKKTTYTYFECLDVMGLPSGKKHDQSAKYLEAVRQTDGLLAVLRVFDGFDDEGNPARIDPVGDIRSLEEELIFTDLVVMESRLEKLDTMKKRGAPQYDKEEHELLSRMHGHLEEEKPLRSMDLSADDHKKIRGFQFLSLKPLMAVLNCDEDHYKNKNKYLSELTASFPELSAAAVSALAEKEIQELEEDEAAEFMADLGIEEPAINQIIKTAYAGMGLISFFTVGEDEVRAWTCDLGATAPEAAGKIHSDLQAGFIRAETIHYDTFIEAGSMAAAKNGGLLRLEGKEYRVRDGDILNIRFNI